MVRADQPGPQYELSLSMQEPNAPALDSYLISLAVSQEEEQGEFALFLQPSIDLTGDPNILQSS